MKSLRRLLSHCANWLRRNWSKTVRDSSEELLAPRELGQREIVSRFIYSKNKIRKTQARPKPSAFDPSPYMELSVVHSSGLSDSETWDIGKHTLGSEPGRNKIYARADAPVQLYMDLALRALRDNKPFNRHTSIIGWPIESDAAETKQRWKLICLELSENPRMHLATPTNPIERI